jgi:hypothetical protein
MRDIDLYQKKTLKINFLGEDVLFTERTASDFFGILDLNEDKKFQNLSQAKQEIFANAILIRDFARPYIDGLPKFNFSKRRRLKKLFETKNILKNMSPVEIVKLALLLLKELEGFDPSEKIETEKKKVQNLSS